MDIDWRQCMCARAISWPAGAVGARRGSALVGSLILLAAVSGLVYATTAISVVEVKQSRGNLDELRASAMAETGLELAKGALASLANNFSAVNPIDGLSSMFPDPDPQNPEELPKTLLFDGLELLDEGVSVGDYSVALELVEQSADSITIRISSTGYIPAAPQNLGPREHLASWDAIALTVRYSLNTSAVFDNAYFVNNWGWFYGSTITCNGNARTNGQFDAGDCSPYINGQPLYDGVQHNAGLATLSGYQDDNGDGLSDGGDGGVWSSWDLVNMDYVRGVGGDTENQHDYVDPVEMPNLSDMSLYRSLAAEAGGTISVGGAVVVDQVLGDDVGEKQHLYLVGTAADPIVLNGPVVVEGDVIIKGYVTGQGAIYSGGNVYVPDSVVYLDPPSSSRPASNTQASTEAWLGANWDKDFLGLFARENIVAGDFTHNTYRYYVGNWMASSLNGSAEDAGEDGIPNTIAGRDGILGTADDDVLEGDGIFTIEYYTVEDEALGQIPTGYSVGDGIPGTGEDIDGDGVYDGPNTLADLDFQDSLTPTYFGGNMPSGGISNYNTIASMYANRLDATFYTNHSFSWVVFGSEVAEINGSLVCRNENIVYGTPRIDMNYDPRLLGGKQGMAGGLLPQTMAPMEVLQWRRLQVDPMRQVTP